MRPRGGRESGLALPALPRDRIPHDYPEAPPLSLQIGQTLGHYRVLRQIGTGGVGDYILSEIAERVVQKLMEKYG